MLTWSASCGCLVAWFLQSYTDTLLLFLWFKVFPPVICWCNHLCNIMLHKWLHQRLCPLQHWVISNSENNSRSFSISSHRGLTLKYLYLGSNFMSEQECVVASSFFKILISKLKAFRISLHSSEKLAFTALPAAFWIFLVPELHQNPLSNRMCGLILVLKWDWKRRGCAGGLIHIQQVQ